MSPDPALVGKLRSACGDEHVLTHHHQLRTYESDGLLQYAALPSAVVLPETAEQVQACVQACHEHGRRRGWRVARARACPGGAMPVEDGVVIAVSRMRRILEVDLPNQRVVVEPGVTNIAVSEAVGPGHFYPPDPSSQIVCSIGGNVAENSGGAHCFKYGFTTNYVTGLEVVLADGADGQLGGKGVDVPGPGPGGSVRGLGGHARRGHQDHAASGALARGGAHAGRVLRLHRPRPARWCRPSCPRASCRAPSR